MARFYLNLFNDIEAPDEEGADYPGLDDAKAQAVVAARALMADHLRFGRPIDLGHRIEIADETHEIQATVFFRDVIEIVGV